MSARYALFFTPDHSSELSYFGRHWLGRDHVDGSRLSQLRIAAVEPDRLATLTGSPRHYGFHGTLKPPFALADGTTADQLEDAVRVFAETHATFEVGPLAVASIDGFIALVPARNSDLLISLASSCVQQFDRFRKPASADEIAMRRSRGLTERQERYLIRWGYPYVMDEFRFHLTLSERLRGDEHDLLFDRLRQQASGFQLTINALSVFRQPSRQEPFLEIARHALVGGAQ